MSGQDQVKVMSDQFRSKSSKGKSDQDLAKIWSSSDQGKSSQGQDRSGHARSCHDMVCHIRSPQVSSSQDRSCQERSVQGQFWSVHYKSRSGQVSTRSGHVRLSQFI